MKKYIHLFACCLLSTIFFTVHAIQKIPEHASADNITWQETDKAFAELSALNQDSNPAQMRSLCGSRNCTKTNCCCTPKNDCCTKLQCRRIITTLDVVESKVCLLTECEPIPLSQSNVVSGTLTIGESGSYCLCCDITAIILITASQVTLDMNCHQVRSIIIAPSQNDISISNGVIDGSGTTINGISVGGTTGPNSNIHLSRLTISNPISTCIGLTGSTNVFISDVLAENSGVSAGIGMNGCTSIFISNSAFLNNATNGLQLTGVLSTDVIVTNCQSISNEGSGFELFTAGNERIYFYNCTASQNGGCGFDGSASSLWNAFDCVAEDNGGDGFNLSTSTVYLEGCLSKNNSMNGFNMPDGASGSINQCTALNNTMGTGFLDSEGATSPATYISNYAQGNSTNYDPACGPPFNPFSATVAGISYWYNTFNA